jgi:hypothetical protein
MRSIAGRFFTSARGVVLHRAIGEGVLGTRYIKTECGLDLHGAVEADVGRACTACDRRYSNRTGYRLDGKPVIR